MEIDHSKQINESAGVTLTWENVTVQLPVKKPLFARNKKLPEPVQILNNVNGIARPGSVLAIMGASGSGKTTLLNVLTHRIASDLHVSGCVKVNGKQINGDISKISAYVQQDDLFFGILTVKEHLLFQAMLRMDPQTLMANRLKRVDDIICELGLTKCADSPIGDPEKVKSLSGGERKRLSFASEILNDPALLFADEPTTGLDSFMAESVIQTLKAMAGHGKTVVLTIHQPSSQIFALFDNLMLLSNGNVVYLGSAVGASDFFSSVGLTCPLNFNPADFYISVIANIPGQEDECKAKIKKICDVFAQSPEANQHLPAITSKADVESPGDFSMPLETYKTGIWNQFRHCVWRSWVTSFRARDMLLARVCQTLIIALFTGFLYFRQDNDQKGVQNINGAIFLLITNSTFSNAYSVLTSFPKDIPVVKRENQAGMYSTLVYYLSKMIADVLPFTILPIVFATLLYWMVGLKPEVEAYLIFVATVVYVTHVVVSFGYFISCAAGDPGVASVVASPIVVPLMLFSGFMLNDASIPVYFTWLAHVSWFKYANEILVTNQWHNFGKIGCEFQQDAQSNETSTAAFSSRCFSDGEQVLANLNYSPDHYLRDFIALAILFLGFRLGGYLFLVFRVGRLRTIRPLKNRSKPPQHESNAPDEADVGNSTVITV